MNFAALMRAFDALMAIRDAARSLRGEPPASTSIAKPDPPPAPALGTQLETTLANVVVAALKEAFDRDHARLELERRQLEEQRRRADEATHLELRRQAAERELGRLRLLAGTALVGWIASVVALGLRAGAISVAGRVALAVGWLLLLGALGAAFSAQGRVIAAVPDGDRGLDTGPAGPASLWLLVVGLGAIAVSLLF
ncbi:MAG TPA: hypothetical protein VIX63_08510 [Vicinamibacterales bacterium]